MALTRVDSGNITVGSIKKEVLAPGLSGNPSITNIIITDSSYSNTENTTISTSGGYIKIFGLGFQDGCQVHVEETLATSVSFISTNEVRSQLEPKAAGSYVVYVTNPNGRFALKVNGITYQ
jgi:hypothetical protein